MFLKSYFIILLMAGWSLSLFAQVKPDSTFELYILIGQSNMAGRGPLTPALLAESNPQVYMFNKNNEWVQAKHPLHFDKPSIAAVGPGLAFGIAMAQAKPGVKIGLIPCAVGGTPIEAWMPGAYDKATNTHPYDDAVLRIKAAMQSGVIKGILWHQGEANSSKEMSKKYLAQLTVLIKHLRRLTGNPNVPFVAGQLGRYRSAYATINKVLEKLPSHVPLTAVATSEGLIHKGDTTHFDGPSAEILGKRFADKMLQLQHR